MGSSVVGRNLPPQVRRVQLGVRVGRVPVSAPPRREEHVAAVDGALVHLAEVHRREVDLESTLITKRLHADVALHALLARRRGHVGVAHVLLELLLQLLGSRS